MSFSRILRSGLGALLLAAFFAAAPASAQSVNPTAQSVKEDQLMQALKPGEPVAGRITIPDPKAASLIQSGRDWRAFNQETLHKLGTWSFLGMLAALIVFYLVRGKIKIDAGRSTQRILRFNTVERFAHWLSAVSFIILAITGANVTFGKLLLAPIMGPEAFAAWAQYAKYIHNYVGFAFMAGVLLVFLVWVKDNIPNAVDMRWFAAVVACFPRGTIPRRSASMAARRSCSGRW